MSVLDIIRDDRIKELASYIRSKAGNRVNLHLESGRFPYTYAYDFQRLGDGSRGGTGQYIREQHGEDIDGYAKEILSRAFSYLVNNYSGDFLLDILDETNGTVIKDNYGFVLRNYGKY